MSHFSLPKFIYNTDLINSFDVNFSDEIPDKNIINKTLAIYLKNIKNEIDTKQDDWDKFKKCTNPYEYIHSPIPGFKVSVSKLKPISRSFYKFIEIYYQLSLHENLKGKRKIFFLAEGPGGFIEATNWLRNGIDKTYAITLSTNDIGIPGWRKSAEVISNTIIEEGVDKTGDLFNTDTYISLYKKHKNSVDLVTADGGFNFSSDFNNQEITSSKLLICEVAYAIAIQKTGGTFIIKFFDTFTNTMVELMYFLTQAYTEVHWINPCSSRYANSEKYIVCKNFRLKNIDSFINKFKNIINDMKTNKYVTQLINIKIPYLLITKMEEYNAIFGQQQLESIINTLGLISYSKGDKIENIKRININKSMSWCEKYNIPFNKILPYSNAFSSSKDIITTII